MDIPFGAKDQAFFPLTQDGKGVIYPWRECTEKHWFGTCKTWRVKYMLCLLGDPCMQWFYANDFGLMKRPTP